MCIGHQDEELEWELERKTVSCKALLDGKLEELSPGGLGADLREGAWSICLGNFITTSAEVTPNMTVNQVKDL